MPDRQDACAGNLDATEIRADGTRVEVHDTVRPGRDDVDCFYVYPTVDVRLWPASHEDFGDLRAMTYATVVQAARFRSVCRLYVPLYRQTSIGAYLFGDGTRAPYRDVAVSDVVDAFLHYMGQYNQGRKVVLIGHSQGGEMVVELLRRFFDRDPAMRERLLLAMPIGWPIDVPPGKTTGGTFDTLPLCTERGQTGCVVAYRSYEAGRSATSGRAAPHEGRESACVEPSVLAHGTPIMSRSTFAVPGWYGMPGWAFSLEGEHEVRTPFVMVRGAYEGRCVAGDDGFRYLAVEQRQGPGVPPGPMDLKKWWLHGELGYHLYDMHLEAGDLMDLVAERAARVAGERAGAKP